MIHFPLARKKGAEPPPMNAQLRHERPVTRVELFDGSEAWLLLKRQDCCSALAAPELSADRRHPGYPEIHEGGAKAKEQRPTFVNLDDPEHAEQRAMLEPWFTKSAVHEMEPAINNIVVHNLDNLVQKHGQHTSKPVDLVEEFAGLVPPQVVYKILGIPDEDVEQLSRDSELRVGTSRDAAQSSNSNLQSYMKKHVSRRRQDPKDDLVSHLIQGPYRQGHLTEEDVVNLAFLTLVAGNAALINAISLGVVTLLQHPDQLNAFKANPDLAGQVVSEILRYHTVSALNSRRAVKSDVHLAGQDMKPNDKVICSVQSADRDESYFESPEKFNIHRQAKPEDVLGFGWGPHRCQGEWLSRLELETVFVNIWKKLPDLRLAVDVDELEYTPATQNVGIARLPIVW